MKKVISGLAVLVALAVGIWAALIVSPPSSDPDLAYLKSYPQPRELPPFELTDQHGEVLSQQGLMNKWTLAFVGYTYCPDICPTTLASLRSIYPQLQQNEAGIPVQVLFISVDPQRDDTERLRQYIDFFNPEFVAATAEHAVLFPLVRAMGMLYGINESTEDNNYLVDHSASVVVIDPKARVIGRFMPAISPGKLSVAEGEQIVADLPKLMAAYQN